MHPKEILARYDITAKKSLGQNFLSDDHVLARIAAAAHLGPEDEVLEIGPGLGSLTRHLAQTAVRVVAVELDDRLIPLLQARLNAYQNIQLIHDDILKFDPEDHFNAAYKVVANVPYYITGAILRHLLSGSRKPTEVVMTVQNEVAERLTAKPGKLSLLAVSVQYYGQVTIVEHLKAGAFWPRPNVDSAVIHIAVQPEPPVAPAEEAAFFQLVKIGFSQRRKQLQKNLRALGHERQQLEEALSGSQIDGRRRAETLSLEEWAALHRALRDL